MVDARIPSTSRDSCCNTLITCHWQWHPTGTAALPASLTAMQLLASAFILLISGVLGDEVSSVTVPQERGHVIVQKRLVESVLVQYQPFTVVYDVLNIGTECVAPPRLNAHRRLALQRCSHCPLPPSLSLPPPPATFQRCVQCGHHGRLPRH